MIDVREFIHHDCEWIYNGMSFDCNRCKIRLEAAETIEDMCRRIVQLESRSHGYDTGNDGRLAQR